MKEYTKELKAYQHATHALRRELRRYCLSERQIILASILLDCSFGWGRRSVRVPKLEIFTDLTGITVGNVHSALKALHDMRILRVSTASGVAEYELNPNSDTWQCRPRVDKKSVREAIKMLQALNQVEQQMGSLSLENTVPMPSPEAQNQKGPTENFRCGPDTHFFVPGVSDSGKVMPEEEIEFPHLS